MSNLALVQQQDSPLQEIQTYAKLFAASGMFEGLAQEAKCAVKIIAGRELGLAPFAAMSELHIIKGKITMSAGLLAKKVKASNRYDYRIKESTDKICSIEFFEGSESLGLSTFTIEQARKAGVQNLEKYPQNMLFARAISNGVRFFCPDVTGEVSAYVDGEIDESPAPQPLRSISPATQIIEAEAVEALDESYAARIDELALQTNTNLAPVLKRAGVNSISLLSQEQADKTIGWLEAKAKALEASKASADAVATPATASEPPNPAAGLDQWKCTQETGSRALALNVISVWDEAKAKLNLDDDQLREEMGNECGITSRKELTAAQANQFIGFLRDFINAANKKAEAVA